MSGEELAFYSSLINELKLDSDHSTCLHYAAFGANEEVVIELLKSKIDIAARDQDGATALHHAAFNGSVAICKLLIDKGAKPAQKVQ